MSEVIEAERELQKCLEAEQAKAHGWLEKVKHECADEALKEEASLNELLAAAETQAGKEAEESAALSLREAAAFIEQIDHIDQAALQAVVDRRLRTILPG